MSHFQKFVEDLRGALEKTAPTVEEHRLESNSPLIPVAPVARRAELGSRFRRELEALNGHVVEASSQADAFDKIRGIVELTGASAVAIGSGITSDLSRLADQLEKQKLTVIRTERRGESARAEFREQIPACEVGIVEADYGIAATGTLALLGSPAQPRALSLLPSVSVIILHIEKLLTDLAAVLRALGPAAVRDNPLVMVAGPSRTADIEKRIVLGVHGPKELYAVLLWPQGE